MAWIAKYRKSVINAKIARQFLPHHTVSVKYVSNWYKMVFYHQRPDRWQISHVSGCAEFLRYADGTNVWAISYFAVSTALPRPLQFSWKDSSSAFWTQPSGAHFIHSSIQFPVHREVSGFRSICFLICLLWSLRCLGWDWTWVRFQTEDLNRNPSLSVDGQPEVSSNTVVKEGCSFNSCNLSEISHRVKEKDSSTILAFKVSAKSAKREY